MKMNGRTHVIYGIGLVFLIFGLLSWFAFKSAAYDYPSFLAFGVGAVFGTLFPDFDFIWGNGSPKFHRSTLTHSAIVPIAVTIAYAFSPDVFARTLLMFISLGMMTHLLFDMFIGNVSKERAGNIISRWGYRIIAFLKGNVGGSFKGFGAVWANKHERAYLLIHSALCIVCAVVLFWGIYNGIYIDGWFG